MQGQSPRYMAYLVRLWQTRDDSEPHWHASIDCPHTAERRYFADLETLFAFLQAQTVNPTQWTEAPDAPELIRHPFAFP